MVLRGQQQQQQLHRYNDPLNNSSVSCVVAFKAEQEVNSPLTPIDCSSHFFKENSENFNDWTVCLEASSLKSVKGDGICLFACKLFQDLCFAQ